MPGPSICSECGQPIGDERPIFGYAYGTDAEGKRTEASEHNIGFFHSACWSAWKEKHPLPDAPPEDLEPPLEDERSA
jgi:hypothetical protein